jgi:hypothetical protein
VGSSMATQHNSLLDPAPVPPRPQVEGLLEDILRSVPFRTSRQCQDLFRYIVERSLAASDDSLRERVIGIEVFGRKPDYDTADDPVVRLRAADIRKRLAQYYQAHSDPIQWKVEIPTGSYKAQFHRSEIPLARLPVAVSSTQPQTRVPPLTEGANPVPSARFRKRSRLKLAAVLSACLAVVFAGVMLIRNTHPRVVSSFDLFWGPVLASSRPVVVCTGSNRVYVLSREAHSHYRKNHPSPDDATPNLETLVPKEDLRKFTGEDFLPVKDTYLTIGDASATAQISSLLTSRRHPYDLRFGSDLSFGDLREGSAVLIGAFNNNWTLNMTDSLRFVFEAGDTAEMHVQDRFDLKRSWWPKFSGAKFSEDYAIVSRVLDSKTGAVLVTIAGLDHTGTRAAGDFVTDPRLIADLIRQAPKDWTRKNLQFVLHTNVVNNIPSSATVVAAYYW